MKDYIKKYQEGGVVPVNQLLSMDAHRANLPIMGRSSIPQSKLPLKGQGQQVVKNYLTGQPIGVNDLANGVAGTPLVSASRVMGEIKKYVAPSIREKVIGGMNSLDRDGKSEVAKIFTEPIKGTMRALRPDKYFANANNDEDVIAGAGKFLLDASMAIPAAGELNLARKGIREGMIVADSQLSPVGRALEDVSTRGKGLGLSANQVAANQLDKVGITANQRRGYIPGVSDLLQKRIFPFGYPTNLREVGERFVDGNRLNIYERELKEHPTLNDDGSFNSGLRRNDAWRMYLGMPQKNNTFRVADGFEPGFSTSAHEDRYGLNYDHEPTFVRSINASRPANYGSSGYDPNFNGYNAALDAQHMNQPSMGGDMSVMGNHGIRERDGGLEYWDRWDLDPEFKVPFSKPRVIEKDDPYGSYTEKEYPKFTVPVSKFIGKPFVSNGIVPDANIEALYGDRKPSLTTDGIHNLVSKYLQQNPPNASIPASTYHGLMNQPEP
jgi:hypothetical protein